MTTRSEDSWRSLLRIVPRRRFFCPAILLSLLTASLVGSVSAQAAAPKQKPDPRKDYALIFGTVWSPEDRPLYGVKVKIRPADKRHAKWELVSDHNGEFAQRVPAQPADYVVWVDAKDLRGYKSRDGKQLEPDTEVTVHISGNERQDIGVHLK